MCSTILPDGLLRIPGSSIKEKFKSFIGDYPHMDIYGLLISPDPNHPLSKVIINHWNNIHHATGDNILIILFQPPKELTENYKIYWRERLGNKFEKIFNSWQEVPEQGVAYRFIDLFEEPKIKLTQLPCLVLFTDINDRRAVVRSIPNLAHDKLYIFLLGLFDEMKRCCVNGTSPEIRLKCLERALTSPSAEIKVRLGDMTDYLKNNPAQTIITAISFLLALASQNLIPLTPAVIQALMSLRDSVKKSYK